MSVTSARASLAFSCVGHAFSHLFEPVFYIVAALALPRELGLSYEQTLALIVVGKLFYGLGAPLAGWLGDRWSTLGMMTVYFLGLGAAAVAVAGAHSPTAIVLALALMGLFGSIYHPVGTAWMVRNSVERGKALGINNVFGSLGPAIANMGAGLLIALAGWRWAFLVPGLACFGTGMLFVAMVRSGKVVELKADRKPEVAARSGDMWRVGLVLSVTMICSGLVYQSTQPALPKLFEERLGEIGAMGVGGAVMLVYGVSAMGQLVFGHLSDRVSPRLIYIACYLVQVPLLMLAGGLTGMPLLVAAVAMVVFNTGSIPVENVLIARYTPSKWRGTAYGLKFILSFGVSGLGVPMVSVLRATTGGFGWLFVVLAVAAALVAAFSVLLPRERQDVVPAAAE